MRIIVFFDLPTITLKDRREYRRFRKLLINNGFIMLQESVYCRMALNKTNAEGIMGTVRNGKPQSGIVMALIVTEKQFQRMEFLTGEYHSDLIETDERIVFL